MMIFLFSVNSFIILAVYQKYSIPKSQPSSSGTNTNTDFLLLNTEFQNDTFLMGFEIFAASAGSIAIKVSYYCFNLVLASFIKFFLDKIDC